MLVIVGLITCLVIGWQSMETRRAAKGALLNAQALIAAERPWLEANFIATEQKTIPDNGTVYFYWDVKNVGRTPAVVKEFAARVAFNIDAVPLPDEPDYGDPDPLFAERILVPGGTLRFGAHWYEWKDGRYSQLYQTEDVKMVDVLVGFGCIRYGDTFDTSNEHITRFCDSSTIGHRLVFGDWSPWTEAPPEYTQCT
jgi:hypothetical protein